MIQEDIELYMKEKNNSVAVSKKANPEGGEGGKQREKYI